MFFMVFPQILKEYLEWLVLRVRRTISLFGFVHPSEIFS